MCIIKILIYLFYLIYQYIDYQIKLEITLIFFFGNYSATTKCQICVKMTYRKSFIIEKKAIGRTRNEKKEVIFNNT